MRRCARNRSRRARTDMREVTPRNPIRCPSGSALVEFAITGVFFFMITFSIMEGSRAVYYYNVLASLAREGTRFAVVRGSTSGRATTEAAVRAYIQGKSMGLNPTVTVTWNPVTMAPNSTVTVAVHHTFTTIVPIVKLPTIPMTATAVGRVLQ